jgi:hypothetical protein
MNARRLTFDRMPIPPLAGRLGSALALTALLAASTGGHALTIGGGGDPRDVDFAQTFDLAADRGAATETYIVARGTPKGIKRVAIGSFCVGAVYGKSASGSSGGGSLNFSKSVVAGFPGGLPSSEFLQSAETTRQYLEARLTAAGIEVIPQERLAAIPAYQKFLESLVIEPQDVGEDLKMGKGASARQLTWVFSPGKRPFLKDCRQPGYSSAMALGRLVTDKDMAGINVMTVAVTMDFGKAQAAGGFFSGAKADLKYGQHLSPGVTNNTMTLFGEGGGTLWLKQAIVPAQNPFTEAGKGEVKRSGEYDDLKGSSTTTTTQSTTIDADHELWVRNANAHMKALVDMYVAALVSNR